MRNAVFAAISLAVAIAAVLLALRPDALPPDATAPPVSATRAPDSTPTIPTTTPATTTPAPTPAPSTASPPSPTPTPPAPGLPTLTPPLVTPTPTPSQSPEAPLAYGRFDATGNASEPGTYAFLMRDGEADPVATTYEQLRRTSTIARFHVVDADGVSRAARYDAVAVGDLFEWRQAEECWTRYEVTTTPTTEASVTEFGVRWMTYAFTGCSGAIAADTPSTVDFGPLPDLGNPSLTYPVRHGPWQLVPKGWTGAVEQTERLDPPTGYDWTPVSTTTLFDARRLPFWRDPAVPIGWTLMSAGVAEGYGPRHGYRATYATTTGLTAAVIDGYHARTRGRIVKSDCVISCRETRVIAGRPARVSYSPPGPFFSVSPRATVWVYDPATQVEYMVQEDSSRLLGGRIRDAIAIAQSLFEGEPSRPDSMRYARFDTVGAADTPGSHAFLSGAGDDATPVTTYKELRDGSVASLLVHTSDAYGTSHAAVFDAVEAGDRFEWWRASNCWVRYRVMYVGPDPDGSAPRKLFGVKSETFASMGCSGAVPANAYSYLQVGPLPDPGGTSLAVPVVHGPWQLVPEGWSGPLDPRRTAKPATPGQFQGADNIGTADLHEARRLPNWREPALPAGWTFTGVIGGALTATTSGYCATYGGADVRLAVEMCWTAGVPGSSVLEASWDNGTGVREFRNIDDRPALIVYSPPGPNHSERLRVEVSIYDAPTGIAYTAFGYHPTLVGSNVDAVIAIARSLFEDPNLP